jgi:putative acetyltransferase
MTLVIAIEDPLAEDVRRVLDAHLNFAQRVTPADGVFALDPSGLLDPTISLFGARRGGILLGIGAIKMLSADHAELKSMHTVESSRGEGVGTTLLEHLMAVARTRGCTRLSLETGTMDAFAPARSLYARCGFAACAPFGKYVGSATSFCMTMELTSSDGRPT